MRLAYTISSYRLVDFVRLGIKQLQRLDPGAPILVSDDQARESGIIRDVAADHGVEYLAPSERRGHFAGDLQSMVNAIAFAEHCGCDVAVKLSQRLVLRKPKAIDLIRQAFEDASIAMISPGRPRVAIGSRATKGFTALAILSDIVAFRPSQFPAQRIIEIYRRRLIEEVVPWKSFIESAVHEAHQNLGPAARVIPELTDHVDPRDPIYLRRYQNSEAQYLQLANSLGMNGKFPLLEWGAIQGRDYMSQPAPGAV